MKNKAFSNFKNFFNNPLLIGVLLVFVFLFVLANTGNVVDDAGRASLINRVLGISVAAIIGYLLITIGMVMIPVPGLNIAGVIVVGVGLLLAAGSIAGVYVFIKNNLFIIIGLLVLVIFLKFQMRRSMVRRAMRPMGPGPRPPQVHHHHYYPGGARRDLRSKTGRR
jgi:hypothetical protein